MISYVAMTKEDTVTRNLVKIFMGLGSIYYKNKRILQLEKGSFGILSETSDRHGISVFNDNFRKND